MNIGSRLNRIEELLESMAPARRVLYAVCERPDEADAARARAAASDPSAAVTVVITGVPESKAGQP